MKNKKEIKKNADHGKNSVKGLDWSKVGSCMDTQKQ